MSKRAVRGFTLWFLFVLCLVPALVLTVHIASTPARYEEVWTQIVRVEAGPDSGKTPAVTVSRDGAEQQLQKPDARYSYETGKRVKAYLSGGRLYARADDVPSFSLTPFDVVKALWLVFTLASIAFLAAALACTAGKRRRPGRRRAPSPARPGYDPERKK